MEKDGPLLVRAEKGTGSGSVDFAWPKNLRFRVAFLSVLFRTARSNKESRDYLMGLFPRQRNAERRSKAGRYGNGVRLRDTNLAAERMTGFATSRPINGRF